MMLAPLLRFGAGAFADTLALMRSARLEAWPPKLCLAGAIAGGGARYDATV